MLQFRPGGAGLYIPGVQVLQPMAGVTAFVPTAISGLIGWWDFSDTATLFTDTGATTPVASDGDTIARVNDKSTSGWNLTQSTGGSRPAYKVNIQNGLSVSRHVATRYLDSASAADSQPTTYVFVVSGGTQSGNEYLFDGITTRQASYWTSSTIQTFSGVDTGISRSHPLGWVILVYEFNGASSKFFKSGGSATNVSEGSNALSGLRLGARTSAAEGFAGDIGETLLFNAVLSVSDKNSLGAYLAAKWSVTWNNVS